MNENDLIPLSVGALEFPGETADTLAARFHDDVIVGDAAGRLCVPASVLRPHVEAEAQRKHRAAEAQRKRDRDHKARIAAIARKHSVPRGGIKLDVPEGLTPAAVIGAGDATYEGGQYTPRSTPAEILFGDAPTGGTFGPSRKQMAEQARQRAAARRGAKRGDAA